MRLLHASFTLALILGVTMPARAATAPVSQIVQAEDFSAKSGGTFDIPTDKEPRTTVKALANGNWIRFDSIAFLDGEYDSVSLTYFSGWPQDISGATVRLRTGSATGTVIAMFTGLTGNGGYDRPPAVKPAALTRTTGIQTLYLTFEGSSNIGDVDKLVLRGTMTVPSSPTTYYVATDGSDLADGRAIGTPFRTIQRAARVMKAGDRCLIRQGIYRETVKPLYTGVAGAPMTFQNYSGEQVFISGADSMTAWTTHSGSIYKASMPWTMGRYRDQVLVDGKMAWVARTPNVDEGYEPHPWLNWCGTGVYNMRAWQDSAEPVALPTLVCFGGPNNAVEPFNMSVGQESNATYALPAALFGKPANYFAGGLVTVRNWYWAMIGEIQSSTSSGSNTVVTATRISSTWNTNGGPGFLSYAMGMLDAPNEWYRDTASKTLYLWAPSADNPTTHLVEAKRRLLGMDLRGKQYVNVTGINFMATSMSLGDARNCIIDDCHFKYVSHYDEFDWFDVCAAGFWRSPFDPSTGYSGIYISGANNMFKNSSVVGSAGSGVILSGAYNTVTNCRIHSCDYAATYQAGVLVISRDPFDPAEATGVTISHNSLAYCSRGNVQITGAATPRNESERMRIQYNDFGPAAYTTKETGLISASASQNVDLSYNWFHGVAGIDVGAIVMEYDFGAQHWVVHHNVFWQGNSPVQGGWRCGFHWIFDWNDTGSNANMPNVGGGMCFNNTVVDSGNAKYHGWDDEWPGYMRNNLMARSDTLPWKFTNPNNRDYSLRAGSPAIDAGIVIPGWVETFNGTAPDLGAYEQGQPRWVAGADWLMPTLAYPPSRIPTQRALTGAIGLAGMRYALRVMPGRLVVFGASTASRIALYNAAGAMVRALPRAEAGPQIIATTDLASGMYVVRVVDSGRTLSWRVIVGR